MFHDSAKTSVFLFSFLTLRVLLFFFHFFCRKHPKVQETLMPRPSWMTWRPKERLWTWPLLTSSQPFSAASKWPSSHPMIPSNLEKPLNLFGSAGVLHWALRENKLTFYSYNLSYSPHHLHDTFPSIPWLPSVTLWVWNIMKQYETFSYRSILVYNILQRK